MTQQTNSLFEAHTVNPYVYHLVGMYDEALKACVDGEAFHLGEHLMGTWETAGAQGPPARGAPASSHAAIPHPDAGKMAELKGNFLLRWAAHCHKREDAEGAQRVSRMFPSSARRRRFLERNGYFDEVGAGLTLSGPEK